MPGQKRIVSAVIGFLVVAAGWPAPATAGTTHIPCGDAAALTEAVGSASASSEAETIVLAEGCEYLLSQALELDSESAELTVVGNGSTISGGGAVRILTVDSGAKLALSDLDLADGFADYGGALELYEGEVILNRVTVRDNEAGTGGAIYVNHGGNLRLTRSTMSDNLATRGDGGGLHVRPGGSATLTNSTLSGNRANDEWGQGGGVYSNGTLIIKHSTITGNSATYYTGGLFAGDGSLLINGSIVAGNMSDASSDCYIDGYDLDVDDSSSSNLTTTSPYDCVTDAGFTQVTDPELDLAPLAANGGPTRTVAIGGASVARGGVATDCPGSDQRGFPRDTTCDIGAYQFGGLVEIGDASAVEGDSGSTDLQFPIRLAPGQGDSVTVTYEVAHGTTDEDDFAGGLPETGAVTFPPGATERMISVPVSGDTEIEPDETFTATLTVAASDGADPVAIGRATATGTIVNDDFPPHTLSVTVEGPGEVISHPAGIACRSGDTDGCEATFGGGAAVSLSADLDPGSFFLGWTDCNEISAGDCLVEMTEERSVIAKFASFTPSCSAGVGDPAELAAALDLANSNGEDDTVTLATGCSYDLSGIGPLNVESDDGRSLTIEGDDSALDGGEQTVPLVASPGSSLTLEGVTIKDGYNSGDDWNTRGLDGYGGGLVVDGADVIIRDSIFTGNVAGGTSGSGGAAALLEGSLTVTRSTFSANEAVSGGAIYNEADLTVEDSSFESNVAEEYGGGINSYVVFFGGGSGFAEVTGSSFSGNRADLNGGALYVTDGPVRLVNSTIHGNWARQGGGAMQVNRGGDDSHAEVINTTLLDNTAQNSNATAGIAGAPFEISNSLLAGANAGRHSCPAGATSDFTVTSSLSDDPRCGAVGFTVPGVDLALGSLAANGGPTKTVALLSGSPAIDAGDSDVCEAELQQDDDGEPIDQRGFQRGQNTPNPCDMGAYEANRMTIEGVNGSEGDPGSTIFEFPVELDAPTLTDVTVEYETEDGTATEPDDYTATSGTLTIPRGERVGHVPVTVHGNTTFEGDREFRILFSGAAGAAITGDGIATGTIVEDDDPAPPPPDPPPHTPDPPNPEPSQPALPGTPPEPSGSKQGSSGSDRLPSNRFRFGKIKRYPKRGITVVPVSLPGPGTIVIAGRQIKRVAKSARGRVTVRLLVRAKGKRAKLLLMRTGRVKLSGRVTYRPAGGKPRSIAGTVWVVKAGP